MTLNLKITAFLLTLFLLITLAPLAFSQEQTIKVGVFDNPPKINIDKNNNVSGIYSSIIESVAKENGWKIEYVIGTFQEHLESAKRGELAILTDVAYSEERAKYLEYNKESIITSHGIIITSTDFHPLLFKELDLKTIATMKGSIFLSEEGYPAMEKLLGIKSNIIQTEDYESAFLLLDEKKTDAIIVNDVYAFYYQKMHPEKKYIFTDLLFMPNNQFFAFPKNSPFNGSLIEKIDSHLRELKKDQTSIYYQELYKITGGYKEPFELPLWMQILFFSIVVILILSVIFIILLNNQKNILKKTNQVLENKEKELASANRMKDLFIDITRHDLLNPASTIKINTQILLESEENPKKKQFLNLIQTGCTKLIDRINSAALFSRLEENKTKIEYKKISMRKMANEVIKEISDLAKENNNKIILKAKKEYFVTASPLMHDVFFNLITNAIKYGNKNEKITVEIAKKGKETIIYVANIGEAIPDEYKKSIFERFTRLEKGNIKGTGLGLAITKKITELHNGKVWVEDNPKGGCIFIVQIPSSNKNPKIKN